MAEPKRLLIVEDDADVQSMIRTVLEGEGYEIATLDDGSHVLAAVQVQPPAVILLDLMMPERDGVAVLTDLAGLRHRPPVLVASAYLPQTAGEALVAPWGATYLAKPFDLDTLLSTLAAMLGGRRGRD